jgi:hypothetical protein
MFHPRTLRILAILVVACVLLLLPGQFFPNYLDSPIGVLLLLPMLSIYLLHALGVPGLLQHDGLCGWGWCAPTMLGWLVAAACALVPLWLVARGIGSILARKQSARTDR